MFLPEFEYVKMTQKRFDFELRKKLQEVEFRDFYKLTTKLSKYKELLCEENHKMETIISSYFQDLEEVSIEEVANSGSRVIHC